MPGDDAVLLNRYRQEDDEGAFAELVRRHINAVYSAALRRVGGDVHLAEDVAQQVFTALARNARSLVNHPALGAWLYVTTRNEAANVVRRERRRKAREQEAYVMHHLKPDDSPAPDWSVLAPVLDGVVDELSDADRTAIVLRFLERRSFGEIGAVLRISEDAARMRVQRALEKMRPRLARAGIASTSAALATALAGHAVVAAPAGLAANVTSIALAADAGVPGAALSLFKLMTTTKMIVISVGLAVVLSVGVTLREMDVQREADASLNDALRVNASLTAAVRTAERRGATLEKESAALDQAISEARSAEGAVHKNERPTGTKPASRPTPDSIAAGRAFVATHPEVEKAALEYHHAQTAMLFGPFYRARGFSEQQMAQFEAAMMGGRRGVSDDRDGGWAVVDHLDPDVR